MARIRMAGDEPKCKCGKPSVWSGYCQMKDGRGFCDLAPRKDNTGPKPLLTRQQADAFVDMECDCTDPRCKCEEAACRTIERVAELLGQYRVPCGNVLICQDIGMVACGTYNKVCEKCRKIQDFFKTFNATGGDGS